MCSATHKPETGPAQLGTHIVRGTVSFDSAPRVLQLRGPFCAMHCPKHAINKDSTKIPSGELNKMRYAGPCLFTAPLHVTRALNPPATAIPRLLIKQNEEKRNKEYRENLYTYCEANLQQHYWSTS